MATWFDAHCHVHDARIPGGTAAAVAEAVEAGVSGMITIGCDRATSEAAIAAADAHPDVWATVGLHPHEAKHGVETIVDLVDDERVVAIGEAGLDYFYDHSPRDAQREAFAVQIALARAHRLPLVIHTRDAWDDTFDVLAAEGVPEQTIFHCFTGGPDEARRCLDLNAYLSFSGIVTFKTAVDLQAAARLAPRDRIMVETDSPYLAPVPHRGQPNRPGWVPLVGRFLADLREESPDALAQSVLANVRAAFPRVGS